jgi:tRNA isopentenyl-2-thiomethyl-A-37 hydroxylase MiaE
MNAATEARIQVVDNHYTACKTYIDRLQRLQGDIVVQQELAAVVRDQVRTFAHVVQVLIMLHLTASNLTNSRFTKGFAAAG